jgi:hypothetical protein
LQRIFSFCLSGQFGKFVVRDVQPRAAVCDKGYAGKANRQAAARRGIAPVIPHKADEKNKPAFFARTLYFQVS